MVKSAGVWESEKSCLHSPHVHAAHFSDCASAPGGDQIVMLVDIGDRAETIKSCPSLLKWLKLVDHSDDIIRESLYLVLSCVREDSNVFLWLAKGNFMFPALGTP